MVSGIDLAFTCRGVHKRQGRHGRSICRAANTALTLYFIHRAATTPPRARAFAQGPWWWNPPPGQRILVDHPREVAIFDDRGSLSGANFWPGLHELLEEVTEEIQQQALWTRHQCDSCRQEIEVEGETFAVRAAVADGLTAVRFEKCLVHGCKEDVLRSGQR